MKQAKGQDKSPIVGIVMGSDSDWGVMEKAASVLNDRPPTAVRKGRLTMPVRPGPGGSG
jgi:hypothetical protein